MRHSRRLRLAAPLAVAGMIGAGSLVSNLTPAGAAPKLAPVTAQQLIARVQQAHVPGFSGTVAWTANLGLPDLSALTSAAGGGGGGAAFDPTSLLSGTHTFQVWDGAARQRIAMASSLAETDLVHNGDQVWLWDSGTHRITRYVAAPHTAGAPRGAAAQDSAPALTPDQVATRLLDQLEPSTTVTVTSSVYVADHRPAYRLDLAPNRALAGNAASTVGRISISIDAATSLPLEVAVYPARPGSSLALKLGFTSFHPGVPSASNFAAPTGGPVTTKVVGGGSSRPAARPDARGAQPSLRGAPWAEIVTVPARSTAGRPLTSSRELDAATTAVSGSFGTARLLQTALVNALIFPDGRVMAGFVTPAALEAAAPAQPSAPAAP